jgi:hypothetical protein
MKFRCLHCRAENDIEDVIMDADQIAIRKLIAQAYGKHAHLVLAYVEQFRLSAVKHPKKFRLLLEELKNLFAAEEFTFQRVRYRIGTDAIAEALNTVAHKYFPDRLENHNYLKRVMIGLVQKAGEDDRRDADRAGRRREEALRAGSREPADTGPAPAAGDEEAPGGMTPAQIEENRRQVQALQELLGRTDEEKIQTRKQRLREQAEAMVKRAEKGGAS